MPNETLLKRLREAGNDYTLAWGSGELYDEAADEIERVTAALGRIRSAIAADRCDGDTEYAAGVNAACRNHLALIDGTKGLPAGHWRCVCGVVLKGGASHMNCPTTAQVLALPRDHLGLEVPQFAGDAEEIAWLRAEIVRLKTAAPANSKYAIPKAALDDAPPQGEK